MDKRVSLIITTIVVILFAFKLSAQQKIVEGVVTTFDSIAVIGARVTVKSTKQTVLTDTLGKFSVRTHDIDNLKIKAEGFIPQKVKLEDKIRFTAINLKLRPGEKNREIAVGYGHVSDRDKLDALAALHENDTDFSQYSDIYQLIKGRFAGVQVVNKEILIRGVSSWSNNNSALIVIDGIPTSGDVLSSIHPNQVKSINILKGTQTAIYGAQGANGVVIIETKGGRDQ